MHVCLRTPDADREVNLLLNPTENVSLEGCTESSDGPCHPQSSLMRKPPPPQHAEPHHHDTPLKGLSSLGIAAMLGGVPRREETPNNQSSMNAVQLVGARTIYD